MALRVPKLVGSKWVYEYPVSAAQKPESNDGSEPNSEGNLLKDYWHQNHFKIGNCLTLYRKSNFSGNKDKQDVDIPMKIKNTLQKTVTLFRNYGHNSVNSCWFKFSPNPSIWKTIRIS